MAAESHMTTTADTPIHNISIDGQASMVKLTP